ncbi:unnamed protein product [Symbiodinium microadriaticum]|nr:unnamed protein product [Symbiodinium microadriaticum]
MGCGTKFQGPFALRQHLSRDLHSVPWPERSGMAGLPPEDSKPQVGAAAPRRLRAPSGGTEGGAEVYAIAPNVPRALRGFRRTEILTPGQSCKVGMSLSDRCLGAFYDESQGGWRPPSQGSEIQLEVGASSKDIRLRTKLII